MDGFRQLPAGDRDGQVQVQVQDRVFDEVAGERREDRSSFKQGRYEGGEFPVVKDSVIEQESPGRAEEAGNLAEGAEPGTEDKDRGPFGGFLGEGRSLGEGPVHRP